jgi:hypothetical protein
MSDCGGLTYLDAHIEQLRKVLFYTSQAAIGHALLLSRPKAALSFDTDFTAKPQADFHRFFLIIFTVLISV